MKISKIIAGMSAVAMIAAVAAIPASADQAYLFTVKKSWTGKAPADDVEGNVKFTEDVKKGATDLNNWDSGSTKYNGQWVQYILTSDDLSSVSLDFTVVMDGNTQVEYHADDPEAGDSDNMYQCLIVFANDSQKFFNLTHAEINDSLGKQEEGSFVNTGDHTYNWSISSDEIKAAVDAGGAEFNANEDGTYTLGFNIQIGHFTNAKLTGVINADNLYTGATTEDPSSEAGTNSTPTDSTTSSASSDPSSTSSKDSKDTSTTSSSKDSTSSSSGSTTTGSGSSTTTKSTKSSGSSGTAASTTGSTAASDATANAESGAPAGIALALAAVAGAAIVVTRRK